MRIVVEVEPDGETWAHWERLAEREGVSVQEFVDSLDNIGGLLCDAIDDAFTAMLLLHRQRAQS